MLNTTTIEEAIDFVLNYNFSYIPKKTMYLHLQKIAETANKMQAAADFIKASQELTPNSASTQSLPQEAEAVILTEVDNLLKNNPTSRWASASAWLKELSAAKHARQIIHPILIRFAVSTWNEELFNEILNDGYDTSYIYNEDEGLNVLMIATRDGYTKFVRALIKAKANVNLKDKKGRTALWFAVGWNKPNNLKALIEAGADVNDVNHENCDWTALMYAARNGRTECVKALIAGKADLNIKDNDGWTPLMSAARNGHTECVKALVDAGADRHIKLHSNGDFALSLAAFAGYDECVKALIVEQSDLNQQKHNGETALMLAAAYNNINCVKALIAAHADLNIQTKNSKKTALHYATEKCYTECAKAIIEAGANLNLKDSDGNTALHIAVKNGYSDIMNAIKLATKKEINVCIDVWSSLRFAINNKNIASLNALIETRPNLNHLDTKGYSHLMLAAQLGFTEGVEALIAANANLNITNEGGSALVYAAKNGHTGCVQALIKANADLNITDSNGNSALFLAVINGHNDCVREILKTNAKLDVWKTLRHAIVYKNIVCLNAIIAKKPNVNERDHEKKTHLFVAAKNGFTEGVQALISAKADMNILCDDMTPLMVAAANGRLECVKVLIASKAKINAANEDGKTALYYATTAGYANVVSTLISVGAKGKDSALLTAAARGHTDIVLMLINAGADVNPPKDYMTPLMYAAEQGDLKSLKALLEAKANVNARIRFKPSYRNAYYNTALMYAAAYGHLECVKALIQAGADVGIEGVLDAPTSLSDYGNYLKSEYYRKCGRTYQPSGSAREMAEFFLRREEDTNKIHHYEDIIRELLIAEEKQNRGLKLILNFFK